MSSKYSKIKLKGNESFNFREGWLRKGMRCVEDEPTLFSRKDAMERLGVGSKMVKSIKFWLRACDLCEEKYINKGRNRALFITENFGRIIERYDPYFDDIFTLCLLHYKIVTNDTLCMVWNIFFNEYNGIDFSRDEMVTWCNEALQKKMEEGASFSEKSFEDDCSSVLRMYYSDSIIEDPEESLRCPLASLGLLDRSSQRKSVFTKITPKRDDLDLLAVLYVIVDNLAEKKESISIGELEKEPNNIGRVFNMSRVTINEYLDQLRVAGYLTINRTAGLDMVYLKKNLTPSDIMVEYYEKATVR